jgi:CRP-like cAMP-binding protein
MENLIKTINTYIILSEQDIDIIKKLFVRREYKKNENILVAGNICKEFFYLQKGLIVHFTNNRDNDRVIYFSAEDEFVCDFESFLENKPSKKTFQTLEDTVIYAVTFENLQQFYKNVKEGERFGRLLMESVFADTINHLISAFTETAEQRYVSFLKKFNYIQQRIPQYYIASFIGVTPQSLSRIRRQIAKK